MRTREERAVGTLVRRLWSSRKGVTGLRGLALTALFVALAICVGACGGVSSSNEGGEEAVSGISKDPNRKVDVAVFLQATGNTYFQADLEGAEKAAEELGNATTQVFDGHFESAKQVAQIEDANASGKYNAYVVFANDGASVIQPVKKATSEGIPVVAAYVPIGKNIKESKPQVPGVVATVWHNEPQDGEVLAEAGIKACKAEHPSANPCEIGYISGGNTIPYEIAKLEAFKEKIATAKPQKLTVVAEAGGEFLRNDARTASQDILQAHPTLNVLATTGDQMTLGAEDAVKSAGLTGKVTLLGDGASTVGIEAVKSHKWYSTNVYLPFTEGNEATKIAIEAARGVPPKKEVVFVRELSPVGPVYTQETTGTLKAQWHP
jgi:ribose transport system substrate-binding protein